MQINSGENLTGLQRIRASENSARTVVSLGLMLLFVWIVQPTTARPVFGHPNILIILADDLGYGDVRCFNPERGKIPTANLDRLASEGMRFTDAHSSASVCTPSRYTLLTGRYHWRTRLQGIIKVFGAPIIPKERLTIGSLARQSGYRTACIGKWHLGWIWPIRDGQRERVLAVPKNQKGRAGTPVAPPEQQALWHDVFSQPITGGPVAVGFDYYFGTDVPNWPPFCFIENEHTVGIPTAFLPPAKAVNPFANIQGPALADWKLEEILPSIANRSIDFIRDCAQVGKPFLLYLALTAPHTPIVPNPPWQGKSGLGAYGDFVMETDAVVGQVLEALQKNGVADNTLVIFSSDNGCVSYLGRMLPDLEEKGHYPSGPYRGHKGDAWEGGHRMPTIVRWPGIVRAGSVCKQLVHQADIMATLADIMEVRLPTNAGEDSFSLMPLLRNPAAVVRTNAISCAADGVQAVRFGEWKLIVGSGNGIWSKGDRTDHSIKLFNLDNDPGETQNLAGEQPARVAAMQALREKLISDGRSNPGPPQENDGEVPRFPPSSSPKGRSALEY